MSAVKRVSEYIRALHPIIFGMRRYDCSKRSHGNSQRIGNNSMQFDRRSRFEAPYGQFHRFANILSYGSFLLPYRHDFPPLVSLLPRLREDRWIRHHFDVLRFDPGERSFKSIFARDIDCHRGTIDREHNARICRTIQREVRYTNEGRIICICRKCDYDRRYTKRGGATHHVAW